jgi:hypothetical protein
MKHLDNSTLNLYLDDVLDAKTRGQVDAHLATCPTCQQELDSTRALFTTFDTWRVEPIPHDVTAQVMTRIASHPAPAQLSRWGAIVLGVQVLFAALILMWLLPTLLRVVNGLPFQIVPTFNFDVFTNLADWSNPISFSFPSLALWIWISVLGVGAVVWLVGNRLIFNSLERNQEASQ